MHSLNALAFVYMTNVLFYILSSYKEVTVNFSIFLSQKTNNIIIVLYFPILLPFSILHIIRTKLFVRISDKAMNLKKITVHSLTSGLWEI